MTTTTYLIIAVSALAGGIVGFFIGTLMFLIHNATLIPRLVYAIGDCLFTDDDDEFEFDEEDDPLVATIQERYSDNKNGNKNDDKKNKKKDKEKK